MSTTLCLKNVPHLTCYNVDIHNPITIIFGRSVIEKVRNQMTSCFPNLTYLVLQHYIVKEETQKTARWSIVRATQSNCCSTLNFLSPEPCPDSHKLNALITRFRESLQQQEYESWVKKLKKRSSDWLNSNNALMQHLSEKCNFRVARFAR